MPGLLGEYMKVLAGITAFLSVFLPRYIDFSTYNPYLLRPLLNIAWAFVFGSHIWYLFFSGEDIFLPDHDEGYYFGKKRDQPFTEVAEECNKFLTFTLFCNAVIVVTTRGLAPYYTNVQYCSLASLAATFVNTFFVPKVAEVYTQSFPFSYVPPATCARILACLTCAPLVIYSLL